MDLYEIFDIFDDVFNLPSMTFSIFRCGYAGVSFSTLSNFNSFFLVLFWRAFFGITPPPEVVKPPFFYLPRGDWPLDQYSPHGGRVWDCSFRLPGSAFLPTSPSVSHCDPQ